MSLTSFAIVSSRGDTIIRRDFRAEAVPVDAFFRKVGDGRSLLHLLYSLSL